MEVKYECEGGGVNAKFSTCVIASPISFVFFLELIISPFIFFLGSLIPTTNLVPNFPQKDSLKFFLVQTDSY